MAKSKPNVKAIKSSAKPAAKPAKVQPKAAKAAKPAKTVKLVKKEDKKIDKKSTLKAKPVVAEKAVAKPAKPVAAAKANSVVKPNAKPQENVSAKSASKIKVKTKKNDKKSEEEFDDDLLGDDFGDSEIAEYEEDLKAVEDDDDETAIEVSEEDDDGKKDEDVYLTDSEGRRLCKVRDCDQVANVEGWCRYHYLLLWKKIQIRKHILNDGKLEKYIDDLTSRYPDKFLEVIKKDLKTEKDFLSVIQEMELDENLINEIENEEEVQSFADEIRGIGDAPSLDDDGEF